jgi:ATP-dependent Clp protease protease subunit
MKNAFETNDEPPEAPDNVLVPSVRDELGGGGDIFSHLLNKRTIVVQGGVDGAMASVIIAELKFLEAADSTAPIRMIINSPGGSIVDGLGIYDAMRQVSCPIETVGFGMQASMGSILMVAGDTRKLAPNAQVLVHQGSGKDEGTPSDMDIGRAFHKRLIDTLKTIYQDHTGLTKEYWGHVLNRDTWFTAEQAKKIGFVDGIIEVKEGKKAPYAQDRSLVNEFNKVKDDVVAKYKTVDQLLIAMNSDGADLTATVGGVRPELAVALAQFPEFWTATRKLEHEKALKAAAVSNDNSGAVAPAAKKAAGPSL